MNRFFKLARPLPITESRQAFDALAKAMLECIRLNRVIEKILSDHVIDATWHMIQLQRARTAMINTAYRPAL